MKKILLLLIYTNLSLVAQEGIYIKLHFIYGSKPLCAYKKEELKWFGGLHGGHVGIELAPDQILNFRKKGKFHHFSHDHDRHSKYIIYSDSSFYTIYGTPAKDIKSLKIYIPIDSQQFKQLQNISENYQQQVPYDYALFGMRCAAASYEILGQLGIVRNYTHSKTIRRIFIPKCLRKKLIRMAKKKHWKMEEHAGTHKRRWEKD